MTRATKTPAQRAAEAVDVLTRRMARLDAKHGEAMEALRTIEADASETQALLAYAKSHPALKATES